MLPTTPQHPLPSFATLTPHTPGFNLLLRVIVFGAEGAHSPVIKPLFHSPIAYLPHGRYLLAQAVYLACATWPGLDGTSDLYINPFDLQSRTAGLGCDRVAGHEFGVILKLLSEL